MATTQSKFSGNKYWNSILYHNLHNTEPFISLPFSNYLSSAELVGGLFGTAVSEVDGVLLTPESTSVYGDVGYLSTLPTSFEVSFDFKHNKTAPGTAADAVYFYFYSNVLPVTEHGESNGGFIEGYDVGFSEYSSQISVFYGATPLTFMPTFFSFNNDQWYTARINFVTGVFNVYIDNVLKLNVTDSSWNSRPVDANHMKLGLGARCGADFSLHYVRNLSIQGE